MRADRRASVGVHETHPPPRHPSAYEYEATDCGLERKGQCYKIGASLAQLRYKSPLNQRAWARMTTGTVRSMSFKSR
jgi:hypothetical protein